MWGAGGDQYRGPPYLRFPFLRIQLLMGNCSPEAGDALSDASSDGPQ